MVSINDEKVPSKVKPGTYLAIERDWKAGDKIILNFPMPIRLIEANPEVTNLNNKVAVKRGPVIYCLELPKEEGGEEISKKGIYLPENILLSAEYRPDFLGGVTVIKGKALSRKEKDAFIKSNLSETTKTDIPWNEDKLYRPLNLAESDLPMTEGSVDIELIPYYTWANRGLSYMDVWIPLARN